MFQHNVTAVDVAEFFEALNKPREQRPFFFRVSRMPQNPDPWNAALLLCTRGERPGNRAAKQGDELPPSHVINSGEGDKPN
jgi:hypothetical protein